MSIVCTHDSLLMVLMSSLLALNYRRCCCRLHRLRCCCFRSVLCYRYAVEDLLYDYFHYLLSCYYCLSLCCCCSVRLDYSLLHSKEMMGLLTSIYSENKKDGKKWTNKKNNVQLDKTLISSYLHCNAIRNRKSNYFEGNNLFLLSIILFLHHFDKFPIHSSITHKQTNLSRNWGFFIMLKIGWIRWFVWIWK